ncbi:probable G-protein coupled receptor CG31760 [Amphiura filiformis]|uniref:probable G-protein coupled receptor CG31760 n=1 Tax=Amphiura filiformis TaxID=82378 RepID=UPI003B2155EC
MFLRYVEKIEQNIDHCTKGTETDLDRGAVSYGPSRYMKQALKTVDWANFYTRIWKNTNLSKIEPKEELFFNAVVSIVENDDDIFAAGNCYDYMQFKEYDLFCPYAYRLPDGMINVKDLSVEYKYLSNESEWFYEARQNANSLLKQRELVNDTFTHRYNGSAHGFEEIDQTILVRQEDGHWSAPYFDCGGGNIWMMTYTVPFFGRHDNGSFYFKGTSGIDIDLRAIDINQCQEEENSTEVNDHNIFAGSDKCHRPSQQCIFVPTLGFRRGSYKCECKPGFYFPDINAQHRYYNGTLLEEQFELKLAKRSNIYDELKCLPCGPGCDECVDSSSCLFPFNWTLRTVLLALQCAVMLGTFPLLIFTIQFSDVKVVKAASPVLLRIILLGGFFLYCPVPVSYGVPTVATCTLVQWFKEIGFATLFGALLLKTWRISVVFRVRSAARVRITDIDLIKRLGLIIAVFVFYLIVRAVVSPPRVIVAKTLSGLKAKQCSYDWWDYAANIAELVLLLWGVRLCYVVRKAPSEFNESRFISWAIYNETMLSLFLCVATFFLQDLANPDLLFVIWFLYSQLTISVVLGLLIGSKIYLCIQGKGDKTESRLKSTTTIGTRQRTWDAGVSLSSQGLMAKQEERPLSQRDIEDELKRLYTQLEVVKTKNMSVGNPHLSRKLTAVAEAARCTEHLLLEPMIPSSNGIEITYSALNNNGQAANEGDWI